MKNNILTIRIFFLLVCLLGCVLIWYQVGAWSLWQVIWVGMSMTALVILTDLLLELNWTETVEACFGIFN